MDIFPVVILTIIILTLIAVLMIKSKRKANSKNIDVLDIVNSASISTNLRVRVKLFIHHPTRFCVFPQAVQISLLPG